MSTRAPASIQVPSLHVGVSARDLSIYSSGSILDIGVSRRSPRVMSLFSNERRIGDDLQSWTAMSDDVSVSDRGRLIIIFVRSLFRTCNTTVSLVIPRVVCVARFFSLSDAIER